MTFQELDLAAEALSGDEGASLLSLGVNNLIAHADDNATDEAGKMASLESLLCWCENEEVRNWFVARGVTF